MKRIALFIFILLIAAGLYAQTAQPELPSTPMLSGNTTATTSYVFGPQNPQQKVVIYADGDKLMEGWDKDGKLILTVYCDGRVVTPDKTKLDEISLFFWREFAKYYRQEMEKNKP